MALKYLSFDLETIPQPKESYTESQLKQLEKKKTQFPTWTENTIRGTDPFLGKIIAIGVYYKSDYYEGKEQNTAIYGDNEAELLTKFWKGISELDVNTKLISFNGFNFDIPWLRVRSIANGIKRPAAKIDFFNVNPFKNTPHVDLMVELKGDKFNKNISVGLALACETCGIPTPKDEIDGSQVYDAYLAGRIDDIAKYVKKDVRANGQLYERLVSLGYNNGI